MNATKRPVADIAGRTLLELASVPSVATLTRTTWPAASSTVDATSRAVTNNDTRRMYMRRLSVGVSRGDRHSNAPGVPSYGIRVAGQFAPAPKGCPPTLQ